MKDFCIAEKIDLISCMVIQKIKQSSPAEFIRWAPSVLILITGIYFIAVREYTLIDNFHLIVHEAGHFFFGFMGEVVMFLGGTLMQLIIPLLLMLYFYINKSRFLFQLSTLLEGHSFINVSIYAADAQTMKLRLFGPPGVKHDWNWLLTHFGILEYSDYVAFFFMIMAGICVAASAAAPLYFDQLLRQD